MSYSVRVFKERAVQLFRAYLERLYRGAETRPPFHLLEVPDASAPTKGSATIEHRPSAGKRELH